MIEQTLAIVRNTFHESIRQPIVLVLLIVAAIFLIVANLTSTFTMEDDQKMLIDIGLATIFLFGALLASFIATNVLTEEIENKTVLTVVSKPVGRPLFVVGKYLGVALAIGVASLFMSFVFLLVELHGVLQTVRDPYHLPVIVFGVAAAVLAIGVAVWCNYFYGRVFGSTLICVFTPLAGIAYFIAIFFDPHFQPVEDLGKTFDVNLWKAIIGLIMANMMLTAIAIAISTRLGQLMTVVATVCTFVLGMLSDWLFDGLIIRKLERLWLNRAEVAGQTEEVVVESIINKTNGEVIVEEKIVTESVRSLISYADGVWEPLAYAFGKTAYAVTPNFQTLWLSDAVTQEHVIPGGYLVKILVYAAAVIVAMLALAVVLFQTREVG